MTAKEKSIIVIVLIAVLVVCIGISWLLPERVTLGTIIAFQILILSANGRKAADAAKKTAVTEQPQATPKRPKQNVKTKDKK